VWLEALFVVRQLARMDGRLKLGLLVILILGAPVLWYLGSPLFVSQTVNEARPLAPGGASSTQPATQQLAGGQFGDADAIHRGEGTASLLTVPGGGRVLRFDDFRVTNGPDLYVYLSGHPAPRNSAQLHEGAAFEVATLKGNIGGQNYELPADLDLARFRSVVIYCKRFSTIFSTAELQTGM